MSTTPLGWRETRARLRADAARLRTFQASKFGYRPRAWFIDPAWFAVLLHRLSALAWSNGHRKTGRLVMQLNALVTGADIHPTSDLGPGLLIPTPCGMAIACKAGCDLTALALASFGDSRDGPDKGAGPGLPLLGDRVCVGPFGGVLAAIRVADGATIHGAAMTHRDVPAGAHIVQAATPLLRPTVSAAAANPARQSRSCPHASWARLKADVGADVDRYLGELVRYHGGSASRMQWISAFVTNQVLATTVHRVAHWQHARGRTRLAAFLSRFNFWLHRLTITPQSCVDGGMFIPHLAGALFCGQAGRNLTMYANALCAPLGPAIGPTASLAASPALGDNVMIGGHSAILGPVTIGNHVRIGVKTQTMQDVADAMDVFSPMILSADRQVSAGITPLIARPSGPAQRRPTWRAAWREARDRLRHDRDRLVAATAPSRPGFPALTCVRLHRLSHALFASGHLRLARWAWLAKMFLTGADISPASDLGPGLLIPHPAGIFVHATAGAGLTLLAETAIGPSVGPDGLLPPLDAAPRVGRNVELGHHSGIYGQATVGDNVRLSPGCAATGPVASDTDLVPRPMKLRRTRARPIDRDCDDQTWLGTGISSGADPA